jgi:hypothetical protein
MVCGLLMNVINTEYTECQASYSVVRIMFSRPITCKRVMPNPFDSKGGDTLACGEGGGGGGGGGLVPTMRPDTLVLHCRYTIIPLRL